MRLIRLAELADSLAMTPRFLSVRCAPTSATEPSVQLDLESGTICRRTSDSRTCQTAILDSCWRRFYFVSGTKAQCESPFKRCFRNPLTYLLDCWRRGSVVRTSVFGWRTFPYLWLTGDHFVGKVSTMGQPTRPTQPSIPLGSVNK